MDNKEKFIAKTKGGKTRQLAKTGTKLRLGATKRGIGPAGGAPVSKETGEVFTGRDAVEKIIDNAISRFGGGKQAIQKLIKQVQTGMEDKAGRAIGPAGKRIKEMAKGGEVKKYMGGGSVQKKKNKMLTTKGWGASRKT
jgi:hypothetical protein